jgi:hypothetical protein
MRLWISAATISWGSGRRQEAWGDVPEQDKPSKHPVHLVHPVQETVSAQLERGGDVLVASGTALERGRGRPVAGLDKREPLASVSS